MGGEEAQEPRDVGVRRERTGGVEELIFGHATVVKPIRLDSQCVIEVEHMDDLLGRALTLQANKVSMSESSKHNLTANKDRMSKK